MAIAKPTDLTSKTWKKIKPLLMKKTGFGESLDAYAKAMDDFKKKPRDADLDKLIKALGDVKAKLKIASDIAEKDKKKDLVEAMKGYNDLLVKASNEIANVHGDYKKKIAAWVKVRTDCIAGMKKHVASMSTMTDKIDKTAELCAKSSAETVKPELKKQAKALAGKVLVELQDLRKKYIATCNEVRTPNNEVAIHADDRDTQYLEELNSIMSSIESDYGKGERKLTGAINLLP